MRLISAGFSHGSELVGILENVPAGIKIDEEKIRLDLKLRRGGKERSPRQSAELDEYEIISGVSGGKTTGANIAFKIKNVAASTFTGKDYEARPGHADYCGIKKYGITASEVSESASARLTAVSVLGGAIAQTFLKELGIKTHCFVDGVGGVKAESVLGADEDNVFKKPLYMPINGEKAMQAVEEARINRDTLGGTFVVKVEGVKTGFGSYNGDRLSATLSSAAFKVPSVKGVEIGEGFALADKKGSEAADSFCGDGSERLTNRAGGIEGGISNGQTIVVRCAVKPVPTTGVTKVFDLKEKKELGFSSVRSDVCVVPSAAIVARAEISLALSEVITKKLGGDRLADIKKGYDNL